MKHQWGHPSAIVVGGLVAASLAATTLQGTIDRVIPSQETAPGAPLKTGRDATGTATPSSWPAAMMTASPTPSAPKRGGNDPDPPPSPAPTSGRPADAAPTHPDDRFTDMLRRLRFSIDQGLSAGEIRDDVALDLDNLIADVRRRVEPDDPGEVRDGIARLREKITTRTREGAITRHRADELLLILEGGS